MHVASLTLKLMIYLAWKFQIALFIAKKVTIPVKYFDYINVFSKKSAKMLPERSGINKYALKLEKIK